MREKCKKEEQSRDVVKRREGRGKHTENNWQGEELEERKKKKEIEVELRGRE